jgi:hypothetical protein
MRGRPRLRNGAILLICLLVIGNAVIANSLSYSLTI